MPTWTLNGTLYGVQQAELPAGNANYLMGKQVFVTLPKLFQDLAVELGLVQSRSATAAAAAAEATAAAANVLGMPAGMNPPVLPMSVTITPASNVAYVGPVTVPPGGTLTIQPGARLRVL